MADQKQASVEYRAFAAPKAGNEVVVLKFQAKPLKDEDVAVNVTHCGICHSDLHKIANQWSSGSGDAPTQYPCVPGHEVIGNIVAVGSAVKDFKVGDRVGFGPQRDSCRNCDWCNAGDEQYCDGIKGLYDPETGGYAEHIRVASRFCFRIPDEIPSEFAAPLLCAGVTVFSPLIYYNPPKNSRVAVVGIGGLGHLAVQYAAKLGYDVTVFSSSADKEAEAKALGAKHFVHTGNKDQMKAAYRSQDFILNTSSGALDWDKYLKILAPNGKMCLLGIPEGKIAFGAFPLLGGRRSLCGSMIGGVKDMKATLEFSAKHKIFPTIEVFKTKFDDATIVNKALEKVLANKIRYRAVLAYDK